MERHRNRLELYVHAVWKTSRGRPLISAVIEPSVIRAIATKSLQLRCPPCAVGGTSDHMHMLARLHPSVSVARLVGEVKGASSHLVTHDLGVAFFRWQSGYGAFTISTEDVPAVERYVLNQKQHHAFGGLEPTFEPVDWF